MTTKHTQQIWSLVTLIVLITSPLPLQSFLVQTKTGFSNTTAQSYLKPSALSSNCYPTDLDCDRDVDESDVSIAAGHWNYATGKSCFDLAYDLDGNGIVDVFDLAWFANDFDVTPPVITILTPAEGQVVGTSEVKVSGNAVGLHAITSVIVNGIAANLNGNTFSVSLSFPDGNQVLNLVAEDAVGKIGLASRVVLVDGSGPEILIHAPKPRQAVYTLKPTVSINYSDFGAGVKHESFKALIVDNIGNPTDITKDLTVTDDGAQGTLKTPLKEDTTYTLTVTLDDNFGNNSAASAGFYVPPDPTSITPPEEPAGAGWVSGVVYDSQTCNEFQTTCEGLAGASVTLELVDSEALTAVRAARQAEIMSRLEAAHGIDAVTFVPLSPSTVLTVTVPVSGTIITGPDGFFAFPISETAHYWLRVEKDGYTYGQREADIVRENSTATNAIYLTPIDPAVTLCDSGGCTHTSSDGVLELEIPPGAITPGEVLTTTATDFEHVEYLPSGILPPGTWETYAFNLGGNSDYVFQQPITVRQANSLDFAPGTEIPLGYWNQYTQQWEHEGFGIVDPTGEWVVMSITHFSNHDPNFPVSLSEVNPDGENNTDDRDNCPDGNQACLIRYDSGTLVEEYTLPEVSVMGNQTAPILRYSSDRAAPISVIDVKFSVNPDPGAALGASVGFELYIEGVKTDSFTFSAMLTPGEVGRFRYLWDGKDAQGIRGPAGVYNYAVKLITPYTAEYCGTDFFGGPPDCVNRPTGRYVIADEAFWIYGTVKIEAAPQNSLGVGWMLAEQQRLVENEAGRILITDGERADEFYFPYKDLLSPPTKDKISAGKPADDNHRLAWVDQWSDLLQFLPEQTARDWQSQDADIALEERPQGIALSPDGGTAYVTNYNTNAIMVVDLITKQQTATIGVGSQPYDIAVSPDGDMAYVTNEGSHNISVVNLVINQQTATIKVGAEPKDITLSPDGSTAYVTNNSDDTISVVDLVAQQQTTVISVGSRPIGITLSPDGDTAYVANHYGISLSVVDLVAQQQTALIPVGSGSEGVAISPNGTTAYVTNSDDGTLSIVDLAAQQQTAVIGVGWIPGAIVLSPDGISAYVVNQQDYSLSVVDLVTQQQTALIGVGDGPVAIALSPDGSLAYITNANSSTLSIVDLTEQRQTSSIGVGKGPYGIVLSADGAYAYITYFNGNDIYVVDLVKQEQTATIAVGHGPTSITLTPDGATAYVTNRFDNTVSVVDLVKQQQTATIAVGQGPRGIVISADGGFAYVANFMGNTISVIDLSVQQQTVVIPMDLWPQEIALSPDGATAYVTNWGNNTLSVVDLASLQVTGIIYVENGPEDIVISPDGAFAYVTNVGSSTVSVVDLVAQQQTATIDAGYNPKNIAISPDGAVAYVTNYDSQTISVVDLITQQRTGIIRTGNQPAGIAISGQGAIIPSIKSRTATDHSTLTYEPASATYSRHYPDGKLVHFNPDGSHDYTLDRLGNKTAYIYNSDGTLATMSLYVPGEGTPRWTWVFHYQDGNLDRISDPAGRVTTFTIDINDRLTDITGPDDASRHYAYDQSGRLTQFTDENGTVTSYSYNDNGRINGVTESPRAIYNPVTGQIEIGQEVRNFTPSDTGYALINDSQIGDPDNPAPSVPTSTELVDRVEYGRGSTSGHINQWGNWLDETDGVGRTTLNERDVANNLTRTDNPDGTCTLYTYDNQGNRLSETRLEPADCALRKRLADIGVLSAPAQSWATTYEARFNQVKTETDPLGRVTTYIYDYEEGAGEAGNLVRVEFPPVEDEHGQIVTPTVSYAYNAWGQVVLETDEMGMVTTKRYTQGTAGEAYGQPGALFAQGVTPVPGLLTQVIRDEGGLNETTIYKDFDAAGNPQTVLGPGGSDGRSCCGTGGNGSLIANGSASHYTYDAWNRTLTEQNAMGIINRNEYDGLGKLIRKIQDYTPDGVTGRNVITDYSYNPDGLLTSERSAADGLVVEKVRVYDINNKLALQSDGLGHTTINQYDEADQLVGVTDPNGNKTSYTYAPDGQLETITDPEGSVTRYGYDNFGQQVSATVDEGGLGLTTQYRYDLKGNLVGTIDPAGVVTCSEYDSHDRKKAEVRDCTGLGLRQTTAFNLADKPVYVTDLRGVVIYHEYDALGRETLVRQDDGGLGLETRTTYDTAGNVSTLINERGVVTSYTYDDLNRLVQTCQDALGLNLCSQNTYDRLGRQDTITDPNGVTRYIKTNAFGLPIQISDDKDGLNANTTYSYDNALNMVRIVDANGNSTRYSYTPRSQVETEIYADGTSIQFSYDGRGKLKVRTAQDNSTATYVYDGAARQTNVTFSTGGSKTMDYDAAGRLVSASQMMGGYSSGLTFTYNSLGDITATTQAMNGLSWSVGYTYDYPGGKVTMTYPSGVKCVQQRDLLGRIDTIRLDTGGLVADYNYHDKEGYSTVAYPNNVIEQTDYDTLGRITGVSSVVADYRYGYDSAGNRTYLQRWLKPGQPADVYQYDGLYLLKQVWYGANATQPGAITAYDHLQWYDMDTVGNRLEVQNDQTSEIYLPNDGYKITNPLNRYDQVDNHPFSYDARGNTLGDGFNTYSYDALNKQVSTNGPGGLAEYIYDAQDRRIAKKMGGIMTYYIYDTQQQVLEERTASNNLAARYTYGEGVDEPVTMERGGNIYYYLRDALGSVTEMTNTNGVMVERYEYDIYGKPEIFDAAGNLLTVSAIGNPYLFTGRDYDIESSNYYFRARSYSPWTGRFLQMDPLGYKAGVNYYRAYFIPSTTDPSGLFASVYCPPGYHPCPKRNYVPVVNGCGSQDSLGQLVPNRPLGIIDFTESCNTHDRCYGTCNTNRTLCDSSFRLNMDNQCFEQYRTSNSNFPARAVELGICLQLADFYYTVVDWVGARPFAIGQQEGCDCCCNRR